MSLGWPFEEYTGYDLYLLDTQQKKLQRLTTDKRIVNETVELSPDARYVAFLRGADKSGYPVHGLSGFGQEKISLCVLDTKTEKESVVATNQLVGIGGFAWMPDNTLLYTAQTPATAGANASKPTAKKSVAAPRPAIYAISATGENKRMLISDAWRPLPSPDGRRIAFFGAENPDKPEPLSTSWEENPKGASLCVADGDGKNRKPLNREDVNYPAAVWTPDAKYLVVIKTLQDGNLSHAAMRKYDVTTGTFEKLGALHARDSEPLPRPLSQMPPFTPIAISNDGKFLYTKTEEYGEQDKVTSMYNLYTTLLAVNLKDGNTQMVAKLKNAYGIDWHG